MGPEGADADPVEQPDVSKSKETVNAQAGNRFSKDPHRRMNRGSLNTKRGTNGRAEDYTVPDLRTRHVLGSDGFGSLMSRIACPSNARALGVMPQVPTPREGVEPMYRVHLDPPTAEAASLARKMAELSSDVPGDL